MKSFEGQQARDVNKQLARKVERLEKSRAEWRAKFDDVLEELDELRSQVPGDDEEWEIRCRKVLGRVWGERHKQEAAYGDVNDKLEWGTGQHAKWLQPIDQIDAETAQIEFRWDYEDYEERNGLPTWMHLVREEVAEAFMEDDPKRLAEELIQVAALCVSWVERLPE